MAVKPHYQFAVIGLLQFLSGQCPILDACVTAVAASIGGFQPVLRTVLTVQACQLLWTGCQCLHSICQECTNTAVTSQVVATRTSMSEWRRRLQIASQWHQTSLQGAYSLWQSQSVSVLAPPSKQWMKVASGQPMLPSDAHLAGQTCTPFQAVEARLTEYHELAVQHRAGVAQFSEQKLKVIRQVDQLYSKFITEYNEFATGGSSEQQRSRLQKLASQLDEFDRAFRSATTK